MTSPIPQNSNPLQAGLKELNIQLPDSETYDLFGIDPRAKVNVKTAWSFIIGVLNYVVSTAALLVLAFLNNSLGDNGVITSENVNFLYFSIGLNFVAVLGIVVSVMLSRKGLKEVYAYKMRGRMFGWLGQIVSWCLAFMVVLPFTFLSLVLLATYWKQ